jgi:hypothetical protein
MDERPKIRRTYNALPPERVAELLRAAEEEQRPEAKAANIAHYHKLKAAEAEDAFCGALRRGISASFKGHNRSPDSLAAELGIDVCLLEDFRAGDATLPSDVIDRLVKVLKLRLMAEV